MIVISQPTYFPWIGYFALIEAAENFIFLDDVQFDSRSWQQRNRILNNENVDYLTVPIIKKGLSQQLINNTKIINIDIFEKHLLKIKHAYSKAKYFSEYYPKIELILSKCKAKENLADVNIYIIKEIAKLLNIKCVFKRSSDLNCTGKRSLKLINICKKLGNNQYLINEGALEYIKQDINLFEINKIQLNIIKIDKIAYQQLSNNFTEKLSIIDVLLNNGPETLMLVRKSYKLSSI
tara:strand:+ start:1868 stop:2575 length:708 start_codon:yes stop_codon:yes gene_type:complete